MLPDDLPAALSLAVMDVCGAPALTARVVEGYDDADRGRDRRSWQVRLARAGRGAPGRRGAHDRRRAARGGGDAAGARPALADEVVLADARDPVALRDAVTGAGGPADVTVVCVDVPGLRGRRDPVHRPGGTVIFFSMATSFSAAALGAEGLAADVTMLVGNGYVPGHAAYALDLLRSSAGCAHCSSRRLPDGLDRLDHARPGHQGKLDLDPATVRKARTLARKAGKPIVDLAQQHTTVSVERATLRLAGLAGADAEGMPWVNRLARRRTRRRRLEHGVALPVWDALLRGEAEDLATLAQKAVGRLGAVPAARGPRRRPRARRAARKQVGAGITPHRRAPPRARAAGQADRRRRRASRGST